MKLISLEERVDQLESELSKGSMKLGDFANKVIAHKNLLKLPPHPSQFIEIDDDGNVLEEPKPKAVPTNEDFDFEWVYDEVEVFQWKQAQSKVLFEGFTLVDGELFLNGKTFWIGDFEFEDLTISNLIPYNLTLTANAKQIIGV